MAEAVVAGIGILVGLSGAILAYVVTIERRLTRLETLTEELIAQRRAGPVRALEANKAGVS
jgi:hypothetical protein